METGQRMEQLLDFLSVIDQLKTVERRTYIHAGQRRENDAEHTWHMCVFALLLHKDMGEELEMQRVLELILIHDLVEIRAGDTFAYDEAGQVGKAEREEEAARELFALLPGDWEMTMYALWREFEDAQTKEARYAHAIDRMQAFLQNVNTGGKAWREHGITRAQVQQRNAVWNTRNEQFAQLFQLLWEKAEAARAFGDA